ncbi:AbrB/MazE/SpoVT family DNA-binding domain-containing protein [Salipaludibacillus aurantiacus]|uniref:Antitoxin component of the MazEF toxin-antitoxin module n=1 Tax=Salipaludibacillus aurantiacus TaxID=1601833 RepID=A0A1H9VWL6_9BACI|nr:AbrB/MazE/SpoVT family DNA-binding domain-containing protein [Salipaludibacillus aurantiacus]SES25911.1 Antitoxin component of the MazEF toxin-antitoxin module [Salipaludibacillus aurantiacus]
MDEFVEKSIIDEAVINIERKITKIGNSQGIIIPSPYLKELGVESSDRVEVEFDKNLNVITIRNKNTAPSFSHLEQVIENAVDRKLKERGI